MFHAFAGHSGALRRLAPCALLVLALVAGGLMLVNTPYGIGVGYDSLYYINAADGMHLGVGLVKVGSGGATKPMSHFPPLYPLGLALLSSMVGLSSIEAARWLGAGLFAANIGLIGGLIYWTTDSWLTGILAAGLALISPNLLDVHLDAMSEPLFFTCLLLFLWMLSIYFASNSIRWSLYAGLVAGLATLTRYIGVSLFIAGGLAIFLWQEGELRQRTKSTFIFALVGMAVVGPWALRNALLSGSATDRVIAFHPISGDTLRRGVVTLTTWFLPATTPAALRLIVAAGFGAAMLLLVVLGYRNLRRRDAAGMTWRDKACALPLLYGLVYAGSLVLSMTFIDASTPLTNRILSPIYLVLLLTTACLVSRLARTLRARGMLLSLVAISSLGLTASYMEQSVDIWREIRTQGRRLTSRAWLQSETLDLLRGMGTGAVIYTNEPQPVQLHTGIPAFRAPEQWDSIRDRVPEGYEQSLAQMRKDLQGPNSALVIFHPSELRRETAPLDVLTEGLILVVTTRDAKIYVHPNNLDEWSSGG